MTERRQSFHPLNFYLLFLKKIYGAADTAEEVDMQLKSGAHAEIHFFLYRYQPFVFHRKPNGRPMNKMKKIRR